MIILNCPKCAKEFKVNDKHEGRNFTCTECGEEGRVPTLQELQNQSASAVGESMPANIPTPPPPKKPTEASHQSSEEPAEPPTPTPLVHEELNVTSSLPGFFQRLLRGVSRASAVWENPTREAYSPTREAYSQSKTISLLANLNILRTMVAIVTFLSIFLPALAGSLRLIDDGSFFGVILVIIGLFFAIGAAKLSVISIDWLAQILIIQDEMLNRREVQQANSKIDASDERR